MLEELENLVLVFSYHSTSQCLPNQITHIQRSSASRVWCCGVLARNLCWTGLRVSSDIVSPATTQPKISIKVYCVQDPFPAGVLTLGREGE